MKNLKKILALAVAFVMCFTMFAGAAVYSDVPAGSDYSEAVTLLSDLGVIAGLPDGSFGVDQTITRADAACLIARMMTGQTNPVRYAGTSNFTDVPKDAYYESAVAYCAIEGITQGTGNGAYSPMRTITDAEFVAMVTRALGYDSAEAPLSFPMGNIAAAEREGLLDGVTAIPDSPAQRGEDAQIIYNALFADYDRWAKKQNVYQAADDQHLDYTIAEEVFGLSRLAFDNANYNNRNNWKVDEKNDKLLDRLDFYTRAERAEIDCTGHTFVITGVDARNAENEYAVRMIDDDKDTVRDADFPLEITIQYNGDVAPLLGYKVELWGNADHTGNTFEVVAVKTVKGQTAYDWNRSMGKDGEKIEVDGEKYQTKDADMAVLNTAKNHNIEDAFTNTAKNAAAYNLVSQKAIMNGYLQYKDGMQYRCVDWDSDGDIDFVIRYAAKYAQVEDITSKRIVLTSLAVNAKAGKDITKSIPLDDDNLKVNADGIEKGDIVEITVASREYVKGDDEVVTIDITQVDAEPLELTKVSTKGDLASIFDETEYEVATGANTASYNKIAAADPDGYDYNEEDIGTTFDLYLNRNGYVVYSAYNSGKTFGYMMVLETEFGAETGINHRELPAIKAKLANDKVYDFECIAKLKVLDTNKATLRDNTGAPGTVAYDSTTRKFDDYQMVGRVFKYYTNEDGQITKLVAAIADERTPDNAKNTLTDGYSYIEKSDSLSDLGASTAPSLRRYDMTDADALFVVRSHAGTNSYITWETGGHIEHYSATGKNTVKLKVDERDVIAISPSDLPDIQPSGTVPTATNTVATDLVTAGDQLDSTVANSVKTPVATSNKTWVQNAREAAFGWKTADRDIVAAVLGVDKFDHIKKTNVKVGLITDVTAKKGNKSGEYIYEIEAAVDGKVQTFTTDSLDGLQDIAELYNFGGTKPTLSIDDINDMLDDNGTYEDRGGLYAEIRLSGEENSVIDSFVVMAVSNTAGVSNRNMGMILNGEHFSVIRSVIGRKANAGKSYFEIVRDRNAANGERIIRFESKDELQFIDVENCPYALINFDTATQWYKIDGKPTIDDVAERNAAGFGGNPNLGVANSYKDVVLMIGNHFDDTPKVEASTSADIMTSYISNKGIENDEYWVADVVIDRVEPNYDALTVDEDAVAIFMYDEPMDERNRERAVFTTGGDPLVTFFEDIDGEAVVRVQIQKRDDTGALRKSYDLKPGDIKGVGIVAKTGVTGGSGVASLNAPTPSWEIVDGDLLITVTSDGSKAKSPTDPDKTVAWLGVEFNGYSTITGAIDILPADPTEYEENFLDRSTGKFENVQVNGTGIIDGDEDTDPADAAALLNKLVDGIKAGKIVIAGRTARVYGPNGESIGNGLTLVNLEKLKDSLGFQFSFEPVEMAPENGDWIEIVLPVGEADGFAADEVVRIKLVCGEKAAAEEEPTVAVSPAPEKLSALKAAEVFKNDSVDANEFTIAEVELLDKSWDETSKTMTYEVALSGKKRVGDSSDSVTAYAGFSDLKKDGYVIPFRMVAPEGAVGGTWTSDTNPVGGNLPTLSAADPNYDCARFFNKDAIASTMTVVWKDENGDTISTTVYSFDLTGME